MESPNNRGNKTSTKHLLPSSGKDEFHPVELMAKEPHGNYQITQINAKAIGYSPQTDRKTLLLKKALAFSLNTKKFSQYVTKAFTPTDWCSWYWKVCAHYQRRNLKFQTSYKPCDLYW